MHIIVTIIIVDIIIERLTIIAAAVVVVVVVVAAAAAAGFGFEVESLATGIGDRRASFTLRPSESSRLWGLG